MAESGNIVEHLRDGSARQRGNVGKDKWRVPWKLNNERNKEPWDSRQRDAKK